MAGIGGRRKRGAYMPWGWMNPKKAPVISSRNRINARLTRTESARATRVLSLSPWSFDRKYSASARTNTIRAASINAGNLEVMAMDSSAFFCCRRANVTAFPLPHPHGPWLEHVHEDEQAEPDNVHEMPVPRHRLEGEVVLGGEMPLEAAPQNGREHDGSNGHVHAVEAGQDIEGGAVHARLQRQIELLIGFLVLPRLQGDEQQTEEDGGNQAAYEELPVLRLQSPVRPGDGGAAGEQDDGVERGNAPRLHRREFLLEARAGSRPDGKELVVENLVRARQIALARQPVCGNVSQVPQSAKECQEEEHLGGDEPYHSLAERGVDPFVIEPRHVLPHHVAEP